MCRCTRRRGSCFSSASCSPTCRASSGKSVLLRPDCSPRAVSVPERFHRLQNHLVKFYPPQHRVKVVYSSSHPLAAPAILEFRLDEMHQYADRIHAGATLYIPPATVPDVKDQELAAVVDSVDHLRAITRPAADRPGKPGTGAHLTSAERDRCWRPGAAGGV